MFRVGQKVVCVDVIGNEYLTLNAVYTVAGIADNFPSGEPGLFIAEAHHAHMNCSFYARRFRPLVERKTDISFAHEILRKVTRKDKVRA